MLIGSWMEMVWPYQQPIWAMLTDSLGNLARCFGISSHRNEVTLDDEENDSRDLSIVVLDSTKCRVLTACMARFPWYHNWMLWSFFYIFKLLYKYVNTSMKHLVSERKLFSYWLMWTLFWMLKSILWFQVAATAFNSPFWLRETTRRVYALLIVSF